MKVSLVIGGSGQLGKALLERLNAESIRAFSTFRNRPQGTALPLDITDAAAVAQAFDRVRPDTVYLTAAWTHVDGCEDKPEESLRQNVLGPRIVAEACARRQARLVFFSSDYVFDGAAGPYVEGDRAHPINIYGKCKLQAEQIVAAAAPGSIILRTSGLYSYDPDSANSVMQVWKNLRAGTPMKLPRDQYLTPTYAPDLAAAAFTLVDKEKSGLFHAAGPDFVSRSEFGARIAAALGLPATGIVPVKTEDLHQKASRPMKGGLLCDKLLNVLPFEFRSIAEGLAVFREQAAADRPLT